MLRGSLKRACRAAPPSIFKEPGRPLESGKSRAGRDISSRPLSCSKAPIEEASSQHSSGTCRCRLAGALRCPGSAIQAMQRHMTMLLLQLTIDIDAGSLQGCTTEHLQGAWQVTRWQGRQQQQAGAARRLLPRWCDVRWLVARSTPRRHASHRGEPCLHALSFCQKQQSCRLLQQARAARRLLHGWSNV